MTKQLDSVLDELRANREDLEAQRADVDRKIVEMLQRQTSMTPEEIVEGLTKLKRKKAKQVSTNMNSKKLGNVNADLYANVTGSSKPKLRKGDSAANVGVKIYAFLQQSFEQEKRTKELSKNFEQEKWDREQERQKELIDAIGKAPKVKKPPMTKPPKPPTKVETPKAPAPPPRPGGKPAPAPAPVSKVPPAPPAPPTAAPSLPAAPVSTAVGVGVVAAAAAVGVGLLPRLAHGESNDYNQLVMPKKGKKAPQKADLTSMTIEEVLKYQDEMSKSGNYPSNAVGKYQIIKSTLEEGVKALKLNPNDKFDEKTQDKLYRDYLTGKKRPALQAYLTGKSNDLEAAQLDMAKEFASFGVPKDIEVNGKTIKKGSSYYSSDGVNKASISPEDSAKALMEERKLRMSAKPESRTQQLPAENDTGDKTSAASVLNRALKNDGGGTTIIVDNSKKIIQNGSSRPGQTLSESTPLEKPAILGD